jgi:hypothetical protein
VARARRPLARVPSRNGAAFIVVSVSEWCRVAWQYIVPGILFKFVISRADTYGSDRLAAKEAGHQLKSLVRFRQCDTIIRCEGVLRALLSRTEARALTAVSVCERPLCPCLCLQHATDADHRPLRISAARDIAGAHQQVHHPVRLC